MVAESLLVMLAGSHWTQDPLWQARLVGEQRQAEHIAHGLPRRTFVLPWLPWLPTTPGGVPASAALMTGAAAINPASATAAL